MKIAGLITEYNPFHNGHLYHIEKAKEITGADHVLAVMSGDYVQRGAPAIMPKRLRATMALKAGVPLILELPVCCSLGSAERFAAGAVSLLDGLGCIDALCFGSEAGDAEVLKRIAYVLACEPKGYKEILRKRLKEGLSFPRARQEALTEYLKDGRLKAVLEKPNNILGIEYIKALLLKNSPMEVYTIKRKSSDYHDDELGGLYSSASAVRKLIRSADASVRTKTKVLGSLKGQVPPSCIRLLNEAMRLRFPVYTQDFSLLLKYRLMSETRESLASYADVGKEFANRILNHIHAFTSFPQFCSLLKTKDTTYTRVSRALFHILLNIREEDFGDCAYARILGFRKKEAFLLRRLKDCSSLPLITKPARTKALGKRAASMLEKDVFSADLYESVVTEKFKTPFISEYQQPLVIL